LDSLVTLKKILLKQVIMRRVLLGLSPCVAGAVYFFGWRCLFLVVWAAAVGFGTEYIFTRLRKEPVSEAVFVTTTIFTLIMPPTISLHVFTIGVIFAVMFSKEIFGGYGRNIFNPAMVGRCFVYICFPLALTGTWSPAADGFWGALHHWTTATGADAITGATPMADLKAGKIVLSPDPQAAENIPFDIAEGEKIQVKNQIFFKTLLLGRLSGSMGVTSVVLILIGGIYLYVTKTASRAIILSVVVTYAALNQILYWCGVPPVPGALPAVMGGGFLFGAFFMATDPVSAPRTQAAKIMYGILIAVCSTVIRNFSIFNGGLMFAILIGNMFAPILDYLVRSRQTAKQGREAKT
jgi:Na+-transporting NADH:ubiquinone oxidoreductase subunit B